MTKLNSLVELIKFVSKDQLALQVRFIEGKVQTGLYDKKTGDFTVLSHGATHETPELGLRMSIGLMHEEFSARLDGMLRKLHDAREAVTKRQAEIDTEIAVHQELKVKHG